MENLEAKLKDLSTEQIKPIPSNKTLPVVLIIISLILCVVGIVGFIKISAVNTTLLVAGVILLIVGIVMMVKATTNEFSHFIYEPTGGKLKKYAVFFHPENRERINTILETGNFNALKKVSKEMNAKSMIEIMTTDDAVIVLAQTFEYIPYNYEPMSDIFIYKDGKGRELMEYCKS
ncbi:tetraspanin family protein [Bacteroidales bacterium OttesenSCG-928-B11]|nr:tetraspanin family protein [Bacteroidales bacterium OttesenSCG-928-E04]MDL2313182.1 tetraspanin family protein [Bacteroidales bacterium OttesenSCG-928-B11]MDL2326631.1 tetraspanin family protein [Bacteroidales bacterium OttesenSCG-928-A14]